MQGKVVIQAEGPLLFSVRKPGGSYQDSLSYVPGSALRGTLAGLWLKGGEHRLPHPPGAECGFCRLFLGKEAAIFSNAYPARSPDEEARVLPATAMSCKGKPGFGADQHGVFDTLLDRLCWEMLRPAALVYDPTCPLCGGRVEAVRGFYVRHAHDDAAPHYHKREVDQQLLTRVAINRRRMVAEEGLLYSPYVISPVVEQDRHDRCEPARYTPALFVGQIRRLPTDFDTALFDRVRAIGGRGSRGLGHVSVHWQASPEDASGWRGLQRRIQELDAAIGEAWARAGRWGGAPKAGIYFSVGLQADAILRTGDGLPTMVVDGELLKRATGIEARLVRSYASYGYGGGWQSAWGLPKPTEVLARAGSVYLFCADQLSDTAVQALAELELCGIGVGTAEGYGQVRVSDEFHLKRRGI